MKFVFVFEDWNISMDPSVSWAYEGSHLSSIELGLQGRGKA